MIHTVEGLTRQVVETRQEITRATLPLYPRIIEMERAREQDGRDRVARQKELDQKIAEQNAIASQQGAAIQQVISTVKAQGEVLQHQNTLLAEIHRWQFRGRVVTIIVLSIAIGIALYLRFGG